MRKLLTTPTPIAPLAVFRVLFGFIMTVSVVRFALNGWIEELYVQPAYHFTFYGLDWVEPLGETGMYVLFLVMGLAAAAIMLGWRYRIAVLVFFLSFTYVELIDKANYLNHYYFVSIVAFLLLFVPANRSFSLDVLRRPELRVDDVPAWTINIFKLQLGIVYVFAGLAKLGPEWLLEAMPLTLWLPAHAHLPVVGGLLGAPVTAYVLSWAGALYDLTIVFFLLWKRTRPAAYAAVVAFHAITAVLFQIGMFPYIMILCTLVFFPPAFHQGLLQGARTLWAARNAPATTQEETAVSYRLGRGASTAVASVLILHFALQLLIPLRAAAYPGELLWTEQGYRFSWRVMLMEKAGYATFRVHDPATDRRWEVSNWEHLTRHQEKMMSTQPDMILQFAHYLEDFYGEQGLDDVAITVDAYVTLNGRKSRLMIDPAVDLTAIDRGFGHKNWILPLDGSEERWISRRAQ